MNFFRYPLLSTTLLALLAIRSTGAEPEHGLAAPFDATAIAAPTLDIGDSCAPSCRGGHWTGGVGLYVMQPFFESNPAMNVIFQGVSPELQRVNRIDVVHHLEVAPLVWLGYSGDNGFGGRARYWYFREGTDQTLRLPAFDGTFTIAANGNVATTSGVLVTASSATPLGLQSFGDTLSRMHGPEATAFTITTKLEAQVFDLEATQELQARRWNFLLCGGLRVARLDEAYNAYDAQSTSTRELRTLLSSYKFRGIGPVLALEGRRPWGDSGLSFYGSARGAVVFGSAQQYATFGGQELRNDDPNPQVASQHHERGLPIGELELGVEYQREVGPTKLFGQFALVGQDWIGAGNASRSAVGAIINSPPTLGGTTSDSDLAFFGFSVRVGVDY